MEIKLSLGLTIYQTILDIYNLIKVQLYEVICLVHAGHRKKNLESFIINMGKLNCN